MTVVNSVEREVLVAYCLYMSSSQHYKMKLILHILRLSELEASVYKSI